MAGPAIVRVAESFWEMAGGRPKNPPVDLAPMATRSLPLSVITLAALDISTVEAWFAKRRILYRFLCQNRALCGCIVAARGQGLLFVDGNDSKADQRFTVAHEVSHFILDYLRPRSEAIAAFGTSIQAVLDGERAPSREERIDAALSNVPLGYYHNLMGRTREGNIDTAEVLRVENQADCLALELLAPAAEVLAAVRAGFDNPFAHRQACIDVLKQEFGLPLLIAREYGKVLTPHVSRPSMARWLGIEQ